MSVAVAENFAPKPVSPLSIPVDFNNPHPALVRASSSLAENPDFMLAIDGLREEIVAALQDPEKQGWETWSTIAHHVWEAVLLTVKGGAHSSEEDHQAIKTSVLSTTSRSVESLQLKHIANAVQRIVSQLANVGRQDLSQKLHSLCELVNAELKLAMQS